MTVDKYQYALDELKAIGDLSTDYRIREKEFYKNAGPRDPAVTTTEPFDGETKAAIMVRYNTFIEYLLDNFDNADVKSDLIRDYLNGDFKVNLEDVRTMGEGMLPVVMMRTLIATYRAPAETKKMPAFDRFAKVYKDRITAK